ncbi:hypothetical protein GCM10008932_08530 [Alkalibacterium iburiense]|uniref:Uncharacterized protein n=1 Tax=Alkalibacterium iburiense TaxID=290589 RepID=A0ABP3H387_9LACT
MGLSLLLHTSFHLIDYTYKYNTLEYNLLPDNKKSRYQKHPFIGKDTFKGAQKV